MAHYTWVSNIGTNIKINILGTHPVSANVKRNKLFATFFKAWGYLQIFIYFLKSKLLQLIHHYQKPVNILQFTVLHFRKYHEFKFLLRFCNIPEFGNNQQFKPQHMFINIKYQNFLWKIKLVFWNVFKIWMSVRQIWNKFESISIC